jgi:alkaline phosphatase D
MLGAQQERWLSDGLAASSSRWQVIGQQVMVAPYDEDVGPGQRVSMDQWSGYPRGRERLLGAIAERAPNRTVVLTGDIHSNWVNELHAGFDRPDRPVVAAEFVGTSIASGGDGSLTWNGAPERIAQLPYMKWHSAYRGYYVCDVNESRWQTEYREVPFITRPGAPVSTVTRWEVNHGRPGIARL